MNGNNENPLFSIVTVCLNPGSHLWMTLNSVMKQDFCDFEVIIKDGLSSDGTERFAHQDPRVRFCSCEDKGIFHAMNQAVDLCRGKYIHFLNAGDYFFSPRVLSGLAGHLQEKDFPPVTYTHFHNEKYGTTTFYPERLGRTYLFRKSLCHQATFIRADCFRDFGKFDVSFRFVADNEFLARLLLKEELKHSLCPIVGVVYRDDGFSKKPGHEPGLKKELSGIQKRYFANPERMLRELTLKVTLPKLRVWLIDHWKSAFFRKSYSCVANFYNRHLG